MNTRSDPSVLDALCEDIRQHYRGSPNAADDLPTALPWLSLIRRRAPTAVGRGMLEPSVCFLAQGEKQLLVGERALRYSAGSYVQVGTAVPVSGQIIRASEAEPYYGMRITLESKEVAEFILDMRISLASDRARAAVVSVEQADKPLLEALLRLLRLLERPADVLVLGRLLKQEIMYHLITAPGGGTLTRGIMGGERERAVSEAISWIRTHYDVPLRIAELAETVHLSPSVLHRRFKAATVMSPLQYQKQVRLLEARNLLMREGAEAGNVAFQVGYESPSQFSREYRRMFCATPLQDAQQLRNAVLAL